MNLIAFFDLEINPEKENILDIGCIRSDEAIFHENRPAEFIKFIDKAVFLCGHNILAHDLLFLQKQIGEPAFGLDRAIDTLLLSPLLFPRNTYHRLSKDEKLHIAERNNTLNDAKKSRELFHDEEKEFRKLNEEFKEILYNLLYQHVGFSSFFKYLGYARPFNSESLEKSVKKLFKNKICEQSDISSFIQKHPVPLAYALSLLNCDNGSSTTPPWVLKNYPETERLLFLLRNNPCLSGCDYCNQAPDPIRVLKKYFGFPKFRSYDGEPLQEDAVKAAIQAKSILVIFPTGGGKSITFQIPALMSNENAKALTVVISPLYNL